MKNNQPGSSQQPPVIDYFFMRHQRRLREKFGVDACEKRSEKIMAALYGRRERIRTGGILWKSCAVISKEAR